MCYKNFCEVGTYSKNFPLRQRKRTVGRKIQLNNNHQKQKCQRETIKDTHSLYIQKFY